MAYSNYKKTDPSETWFKKKAVQDEWTVEKTFNHPVFAMTKQLMSELLKIEATARPSWFDQIYRSILSIGDNWGEYAAKGYGGVHSIVYGEAYETLASIELGPEEFKEIGRPLILRIINNLRQETERQ